nr:uncharacterized protein LOC109417650 isoform X2 [Aedes albopictus]
MGAIGWTQDDGKVLWHCGGTLIWMDYVVTAAHCVVDHQDVRPDIVRFGDLNLETDEDDEYAQQYKIVQIYRHPLHRFGVKYHDIALIKMEQPVRLHDTVCPACLWIDPEIRFTEFIATGWGSTGPFEDHTPSLLKVSLKPMESSKCGKFYTSELVRGLSAGLHENHLCAVDEKMDTCEGDSGGPLQVKLLHNARLTPFVVAVTSFGLPCGLSNPGVYTKIGPYHDWILATMRQGGAVIEDDLFNATFCALRFNRFREHIYTERLDKIHVYEFVYLTTHHIYNDLPPKYLVQLMWNVKGAPQNCYGTIIDENTVLTVAYCVHYQGIPASAVSHPEEGVLKISKINVHPQYNPAYGYYNIAILRLEKLYSFINIRPVCIDYGNVSAVPNSVFGFGRRDIYDWDCYDFPECIDPSLIPLTVYIEPKNETTCRLPKEYVSRFPNGITDELICVGTDRFLVPGACDLKLGGTYTYVNKNFTRMSRAIDRTITGRDELYPQLDGLVQIGRDCGYGEHLLSTRIQSHIKWMERVLLPKTATVNAVQFLEQSRHVGDSCTDANGVPGRCTAISRCQRKWKKFELTKEATFCSSTSVICCPNADIDKDAWSSKHSILMKCPKLVNDSLPETNGAPMVRILDNSNRYICMGAIISDRTVLTSASCVHTTTTPAVQPLGNFRLTIQVRQIVQHSSFNATDYSNDIAILRLPQSLVWGPNLHPACLWNNQTHSPLIVEMLQPFNKTDGTDIKYIDLLTMYNSDCQRTHAHPIRDSHICVKYPYREYTCFPSHSMLRWEDAEGVPYLIGLSTDTRECMGWSYMTFSRIAAFIDWIVDNIADEEIRRSFNV